MLITAGEEHTASWRPAYLPNILCEFDVTRFTE